MTTLDIDNATRHDVDVFLGKTEKCSVCGEDIPRTCTEAILGMCKKCRPYIEYEDLEDILEDLEST